MSDEQKQGEQIDLVEDVEKTTQSRELPRRDLKPIADTYVGTILSGRYEVVKLVGKGGMGSLYAGKHTEIGRDVAIKILSKDLKVNEEAFLRFKQEAQLAGTLSHNHICSVYDFGKLDDDTPYLIMDLLRGSTLSQILEKEKRLEPERAVKLFVQLCDALSYAHVKGIVHRDLKPSNIMVDASHTDEQCKILDFGIAKSLEGDGPKLTATHEVIGSPQYMSPEQCQGTKMDHRSDIYSLGCLMYECLTGTPPFNSSSVLQTMYAHVHTDPERLSKAAPDLRIPAGLESVILKAMRKNPQDRYNSADALKNDLLRCVGSSELSPNVRIGQLSDGLSLPKKTKLLVPVLVAGLVAAIAVWMNWDNIQILLDGRMPGEIYNGDDDHSYSWKLNSISNPQIHAVFLGQGHDTPRSKDNDLTIRGHATVEVSKRPVPITLVLGSHAQIEWKVVAEPGAQIVKVITYSVYGHPKVNGVPQDIVQEIEPVAMYLSEGENLDTYSNFGKLNEAVSSIMGGKTINTMQYAQQIRKFAI